MPPDPTVGSYTPNEVDEGIVVQGVLADFPVEVDVLEHILQGFGVGFFQSLVQHRADVFLECLSADCGLPASSIQGSFQRARGGTKKYLPEY